MNTSCLHNVSSSLTFSTWEALDDYLGEKRDYKTLLVDTSGNKLMTLDKTDRIHWSCKACKKLFATKQSVERHLERFPVCKAWKQEDGLVLTEPVSQWASNVIGDAIQGKSPRHCKFCNIEFSTVGNFNKHFSTSVPCNRLAYKAVKEAFAEA